MTSRLAYAVSLLILLAFAPHVVAQSADGMSRLVYVTQDPDTDDMTISTANPDGSDAKPLLNNGYFFYPALSPDGRQLVFMGDHPRTHRRNLYLMNMDGTNLRPLVERPTATNPEFAAWSPDGTMLIYGGADFNRDIHIYTINADGTGQAEITFDGIPERLYETWVAWSPDGTQIAAHAVSTDYSMHGELYVANADGSGAHLFPARLPNGESYSHLAWSPDGQQVALTTLPGLATGDPEPLGIANADGSNARVLVTPPPNFIGSAAWSPDGSQLVFTANEPGVPTMPNRALWIVNADGTNAHALNLGVAIRGDAGTDWGMIPADVVLPSAPVSFADVAG